MHCPLCQHPNNRVLESRSAEAGRSIRRRRECLSCQRRFTTYERIEHVQMTVVKRKGERESFDRAKVLRGIARACEKTGLPQVTLEAIVDDIEAELQQQATREINSIEIGELVLKYLQPLNEVAYVRFASVYRKFQGIREFSDTLEYLKSANQETTALDFNDMAMSSTR